MFAKIKTWFVKEKPPVIEEAPEEPKPEPTWFQNYINSPYK